MTELYKLPDLPSHKVEIKKEVEPSGFLKIRSYDLDFEYDDGRTANMVVDTVHRHAMDAVCILGYYEVDSKIAIYLRSCIRPAVIFKDFDSTGRLANAGTSQWEIPAGLIEKGEFGDAGVFSAASREFEEEVGIKVDPSYFESLGPFTYSSVGITGERLFFVSVYAPPDGSSPIEDGSPLERGGKVASIYLDDALYYIESGELQDTKTIIGIMRLKERFK